jgi:TolB-like protein/Flp pilus assembly protein TadD
MDSPSPEHNEAMAGRAVFLSYAREDTPAAQRIADGLTSQGVEVWFDQSELRGGDAWDQKIRRQIKECALFVPIISSRTQARGEGYFRLEWKLAVERTHLMAEGVPFLAPVVVDETPEGAAIVPAEFLRVQWIRLQGALPTPQFVGQVKRMLAAPAQPAASLPRARTGSVPAGPGSRMGPIIAGVIVVLAILGTVIFLRRPPAPVAAPAAAPAAVTVSAPSAAQEAVDAKSIAVLPFENMSEDKDNAFFTDGVHEDVLTNLSFIKDLHVTSRTSVMQYKGTTKSIKEIGRELGVAYVLEGSVRREGNKVRVTGQLIDARTDEHVWAKAYDRDLNDIFAIQGELAQAIADALQSVLSPATKELLARRPTENTEAYDDYVKARQIRAGRFLGAQEASMPLLEAAVRLDPKFAQAWAELGSRRAFAYFNDKHTDEQLRQAKDAIDTATSLAPDDPAVIEGAGDFYYYGHRDYVRATEQYMRLAQLRPNDASVFESLGLIQRREGRFPEALENLQRGMKLDPTNVEHVSSYLEVLNAVRRYDEYQALLKKELAANPDSIELVAVSAVSSFTTRGSKSELEDFLRRPVPDGADRAVVLYLKKSAAVVIGDWEEFKRLDGLQRYFDGNGQDPRCDQDANAAQDLAESGDMDAARKRAAEALVLLKAAEAQQPESADIWSGISLAHALLGEKEEALSAGQKAMELLPTSLDAVQGPSIELGYALTLAWVGEKDEALARFQRLLGVPYGANVYLGRTFGRPLHGDPRYEAMLNDPKNNGPIY